MFAHDKLEDIYKELDRYPEKQLINIIFSGLSSANPVIKWHAVKAMGYVVNKYAACDLEKARIIIRRLIWSLYEESGSIGWGAPESLGEIVALNEALRKEYASILVSFMDEEGSFLEHEPLQRGVLWGIGRLSQIDPKTVIEKNTLKFLPPYLRSPDPGVRGLALWILGILQDSSTLDSIESLSNDNEEFQIYMDDKIRTFTVGLMANQTKKLFN